MTLMNALTKHALEMPPARQHWGADSAWQPRSAMEAGE